MRNDKKIRYGNPGNGKANTVRLPVLAAAATVIVLLCFFVFFYSNNSNNPTDAASTASPSLSTPLVPTPPLTPTQASLPAITTESVPATMWGANFPGKFTDGEVIKNDSSTKPTIGGLSLRFQKCKIEVVGSYKSAHINVTVNKVEESGNTYFVSDIYVTDMKYFIAPFSDGKFSKDGSTGAHYYIEKIARDNKAVVAVNGDYYAQNPGPVMRDGILYRNEVYRDILVMFKDGTMKTYAKGEYDKNTIKSIKDDAWDIWTFGPELLSGGQPKIGFNSTVKTVKPRTAVGYFKPGHYCFVTVDGRQPGYSKGLDMKSLSKLMCDLGCKAAFNLDGGGSAQLAFMGKEINTPCSNKRKNGDALCIIDEPVPEITLPK
jgi:exopolysaccharide biosynthesis protein